MIVLTSLVNETRSGVIPFIKVSITIIMKEVEKNEKA